MNIKSFREKLHGKITKQSVKSFFKKQGLYVLIFLCLVAAGITALVAWPRDESELQIGDPDISTSDNNAVTEDSPVSVVEAPTLEEEQRELDEEVHSEEPGTEDEDTAVSNPKPANNGSGSIKLAKPLDGQIVQEFSGDSLVYYASLNMWATHNGIDFKADENTEVKAALSGTVEDVYSNEADGGVVVVSHSSTSKTVYAGLGDIAVKVGDKVSVGHMLGKVGELPKELDLSYHLHFEYIVDGSYKDPAKYF